MKRPESKQPFLLVLTYNKHFSPYYQIIDRKGRVIKTGLTRQQGLKEIDEKLQAR